MRTAVLATIVLAVLAACGDESDDGGVYDEVCGVCVESRLQVGGEAVVEYDWQPCPPDLVSGDTCVWRGERRACVDYEDGCE